MAIQLPNAGLGDGQTGDNEFVMWTKVKDNFTDQTNAASRLIGAEEGRVPSSKDVYKAAYSTTDGTIESGENTTLDTLAAGARYLVKSPLVTPELHAMFNDTYYYVETVFIFPNLGSGVLLQTARCYTKGGASASRVRGYSGIWSVWQACTTNINTYSTTTATGANVVVDVTGKLMRSTSSERYKDILAPLELDDARYEDAMALKPIVYRSTADADNPAYHYYSFSAEELGAYDPAFTLWRETETVTDDEGNTSEQPLDERVAEGINLNAIVAFLHATNVKQGNLIDELSARIGVLEDANK